MNRDTFNEFCALNTLMLSKYQPIPKGLETYDYDITFSGSACLPEHCLSGTYPVKPNDVDFFMFVTHSANPLFITKCVNDAKYDIQDPGPDYPISFLSCKKYFKDAIVNLIITDDYKLFAAKRAATIVTYMLELKNKSERVRLYESIEGAVGVSRSETSYELGRQGLLPDLDFDLGTEVPL